MTMNFLTNKPLNYNENVFKTERVAKGNYKFTTYETVERNYMINTSVLTSHTHNSGTKSDIDIQLDIHGHASIEGLMTIAVYCKANDWFFACDDGDFQIMSGIANKLHGITSLLKVVNKYGHVDTQTVDVYDVSSNDYLFTANVKNVDVVKTLQNLDRGYLFNWVTNRPDFITK